MADQNDTDQQGQEEEPSALRTKLSDVTRENAMLRAGVDLDSPLGRYFHDGFKGKLEQEAIKAAWAEIAPPKAQETPPPAVDTPPPPPPAAEADAHQAAAQLGQNGVPGVDTPTEHPATAAIDGYFSAMRGGTPQKHAAAAAFDQVFGAAADGDQRVIIPQGRQGRDT